MIAVKVAEPKAKRRRVFNAKKGWRQVGDKTIYFRSEWEYKTALKLEFLKANGSIVDWEHESDIFWFDDIKRGVRSYMPDFKVLEKGGTHYWIEVKGYMDDKSRTKIKRFGKYFPDERLVVITNVQ